MWDLYVDCLNDSVLLIRSVDYCYLFDMGKKDWPLIKILRFETDSFRNSSAVEMLTNSNILINIAL